MRRTQPNRSTDQLMRNAIIAFGCLNVSEFFHFFFLVLSSLHLYQKGKEAHSHTETSTWLIGSAKENDDG